VVVSSIIGGVLLLVDFSGGGAVAVAVAVDSLVLLGGLASSVSGTIGALVLLSLKTFDLLLGLGDVLQGMYVS
jgi:hypothetical protein